MPKTTLQSRRKLLITCFFNVTLSLRGTNIDRVLIQKTLHFYGLCSRRTSRNKLTEQERRLAASFYTSLKRNEGFQSKKTNDNICYL